MVGHPSVCHRPSGRSACAIEAEQADGGRRWAAEVEGPVIVACLVSDLPIATTVRASRKAESPDGAGLPMAMSSSGGDPPDLSRGGFLQAHILRPGGEVFRVLWKCWEVQGSLRWELRRILPDLGVREAGHTHMCRQLKQLWPGLQAILMALDLPIDKHRGKSRRALITGRDSEDRLASAEQELWVSIAMLVALLLAWPQMRRRVLDRHQAEGALQLLFEACLDSDVKGSFTRVPSDEVKSLCQEEPVLDNVCRYSLLGASLNYRSSPARLPSNVS